MEVENEKIVEDQDIYFILKRNFIMFAIFIEKSSLVKKIILFYVKN